MSPPPAFLAERIEGGNGCATQTFMELGAKSEWASLGARDAFACAKGGSPGRIRTCDQPVNSRLLYH